MPYALIQHALRFERRLRPVNWVLADQAMVSGANFFTGVLVARYLGIEQFGRFTLAWMVVLFVASIQHAVINAPMMSIGPKEAESDVSAYYGAVVIQQAIFTALSFVLVAAGTQVAGWLSPQWTIDSMALPLATAAAAYQVHDFLRRYFFTRGRAVVAVTSDAVRYFSQLAILALLFRVFGGDGMDSATALWAISCAAAMASLGTAFLMERPTYQRSVLQLVTARHWHFSKWLTASALMAWTGGNLFNVIAGALLGASAVGALKAAQNLVGITHILFNGLENVVPFHASIAYKEGGFARLVAFVKKVTFFTTSATIGFALPVALFSNGLMERIYGTQYRDYGWVLIGFAIVYSINSLGLGVCVGLRTIESTFPILLAYILSCLCSLAIAIPLIVWCGLIGVIFGLIVSTVILVFVPSLALYRRVSCEG